MSNKTPATLIPANYSNSAPDNLGITSYDVRAGRPYLSGSHIVNNSVGPFGVPYFMEGIAIQTCNKGIITAPAATVKDIGYYRFQPIGYGHVNQPFGSAPTSGVYTGVEDHC